MALIIYCGPILIGFVLGYFLATPAIVVITIIAAIIAILLRPKKEQELGALVGVIAWVVLGLGVATMWGTHLYVTKTDFGLTHIFSYIFR